MVWFEVGVIAGCGLCDKDVDVFRDLMVRWMEMAGVELNITKIKAYQRWGGQETHMGWPMAHTRL